LKTQKIKYDKKAEIIEGDFGGDERNR